MITHVAGMYTVDYNVINLFYGDFFRDLMEINNRTFEEQVCATISHEVVHAVLNQEQNWKVCCKFDNIAPMLRDYGVW